MIRMMKIEKKERRFSSIAYIFLIFSLILLGIIFKTTNLINRMTMKEKNMHRYSSIAYVFLNLSLILLEITFFLILLSLRLIGIHLGFKEKFFGVD